MCIRITRLNEVAMSRTSKTQRSRFSWGEGWKWLLVFVLASMIVPPIFGALTLTTTMSA